LWQDEMTVVGRVCCDSNGKLNAKSVLLAGSRSTSGGRHIPLEVSALPRYSLFPGQVLALSGINSSGAKFVAKSVFEVSGNAAEQ
jgi:DNA polymerase alpha subunit B